MTSSADIIAKFEAAFETFEMTHERLTDLYVTQIHDATAKTFTPFVKTALGRGTT